MSNNRFKIGEKIKLKSYDNFQDYSNHNNQIATVYGPPVSLGGTMFDYSILWTDGVISNAVFNNIKLYSREWDDEVNK